ncbi:hypothetical protein ABMA28_009818 [Loxostege sticticalis]|uniref:Uncharacterized protein n=1 Tax=Loxostege sticticalis TaxID=481309 RepID=A0ABD0SBI0_LOXSC
MPKRRNSEDCEYISRKIKKLERKLKRVRHRNRENNEESSRNSSGMYFTAYLQYTIELIEPYESPQPPESPDICVITSDMQTPENHTTDTQSKIQVPEEPAVQNNALDSDALDILGADPSSQIQYAKNVHTELASRLEHIATSGLTKELRKELNERYLIPGNCIMIGAPLMNPEIKAAVTDTVMKRDKGIEARQKQLAAAISGLAIVLHNELENKDKDTTLSKDTLKQLMDVSRILCDIQHSESVTRRNFAAFSIKKELKDHLYHNTKIDKTLFGENLAETLRSAKAVSKSGSDLKTKTQPKPKPSTSYSTTSNLNWRSPAPARRQPPPHRNQENTRPLTMVPGQQQRYNRNQMHASSSKTSQPPSKQIRRR